MYKKTLINLAAITTAMSLAFGPAVTTLAADGEAVPVTAVEVTVTEEPVETEKEEVPVEAPAEETTPAETPAETPSEDTPSETPAEETRIVRGEDDKDSVTVNEGTVVIEGTIVSEEEAKAALTVENGASAVVEDGDVTGILAGVRADDGSKVVVNGDVYAEGYTGTSELSAGEANGSGRNTKTQGSGIVTDGTADIYVDGDAVGSLEGLLINPQVNAQGGRVVVTGKLGSTDTSIKKMGGVYIGIVSTDCGADFGQTGETAEEIGQNVLDAIPEFYAYAYENRGYAVAYNVTNENVTADQVYHGYVQKGLDKKSHFIIRTDDATKEHFTVSGYDEDLMADYNLMTMTADTALKVAVDEGYTISAGDNVKIVDNGDGTYTIKVTNFQGGITITAKLKTVSVPTPVAQESPRQAAPVSYSEPSEEVDVTSLPFIFATFTISKNNADLPEVLGASLEDEMSNKVVAPKQVVKIASGELSAIQYKKAFIDACKNAPVGAVLRLETAKATCFDKMMIEALAARPDLTLEVAFPVNGETVDLSVPAGYDVMSLLDDNGYCGFLYLNHMFGHSALA